MSFIAVNSKVLVLKMKAVKAMKASLKDYCKKTDLVGISYISNTKIHLSERIFWTICLILAAVFSYRLVRDYQRTFESNAIGFVIENMGVWDKIDFISVGICEEGSIIDYPHLTEYLQRLYKPNETIDDDILDFIRAIVYSKWFFPDTLKYNCGYKESCSDCVQCPQNGYREIADVVVKKCKEMMLNCSWNAVPFDCCNYFLPLSTPLGTCFLLNSLHTTTKYRNSTHWLKTEVGFEAGDGEMILQLNTSIDLYLLNKEDVPSELSRNRFTIHGGKNYEFELYVQDMINDPEIREISPEYRKCQFPDENLENSAYGFYSLSTCAVDCLKRIQFENCGCNIYQLLVKTDDEIPPCNYSGVKCLEEYNHFHLPFDYLKPWSTNEKKCECLPSCNEKDYIVFSEYNYGENQQGKNPPEHQISIKQKRSSELFRRQAIRTPLDIVVTIGGVFGLFMGASIISIVEIFYFVCIRIFNSST